MTPTAEITEWYSELETTLFAIEDCPVQCDGMTYLVSHLLHDSGVEHTRMIGHTQDITSGDLVTPHCWIELPNGYIIDMRLRMWLGDYDYVPHGVFNKDEYTNYTYIGQPMTTPPVCLQVLELMCGKKLSHVKVPALSQLEREFLSVKDW